MRTAAKLKFQVFLPEMIMSSQIDPQELTKLALFEGLTTKQLAWLDDHLHCKIFSPNTNIILIEQPGEVVYVILSGTVKIHIEQADGTDVILAILGRGDTVGEMSMLDSAGRSASAITLEKTTLLWMDRNTFQESLQVIPTITFNLVRILSARIRMANEMIQALSTLDVYGRVARQLLAFADKYGEKLENGSTLIPIHLTQSEIAGLVGASRKRVNQVIVAFKQHEYIYVDTSGRITIQDRDALASFADRHPTFPAPRWEK